MGPRGGCSGHCGDPVTLLEASLFLSNLWDTPELLLHPLSWSRR